MNVEDENRRSGSDEVEFVPKEASTSDQRAAPIPPPPPDPSGILYQINPDHNEITVMADFNIGSGIGSASAILAFQAAISDRSGSAIRKVAAATLHSSISIPTASATLSPIHSETA